MSHSNTEETTTLKTKVYESSLEWNIENFDEYSKCDIGSIASRKIRIEGTDVYWTLSVHPNGYHSTSPSYDDSYISLSLQIKCENPMRHHCFKIDVKTDVSGHRMMSPHLHDDESEFTVEYNKPARDIELSAWNIKYENVGMRQHLELYKQDFIKVNDLSMYMFGGTLRLLAKVAMIGANIEDHIIKHKSN